MSLVFALQTAVLQDAHGLPYRVQGGQPWDADDPLVRLHPSFFASQPPEQFVGTTRPGRSVLEQATHEPGELRPARRGGGA